ncbi:MAG TPA: hypothetical protein VIY86_14270, partial [Pirellulaceae bacterium]
EGLEGAMSPRSLIQVTARGRAAVRPNSFSVLVRIDTPVELEYYRNGGILPKVLRMLLDDSARAQ